MVPTRPTLKDESPKKRFEDLALPQLDAVYRMARRLTPDANEAEDLVQEAYLRAYRAFPKFELRDYGIKPWLFRIVHNVFYTAKGKQRRQPSLLDDVDFDHFADELSESPEEPLTADRLNWEEFDEELKAAVQELPVDYRSVLLLWAIEELSYKEIAQVCGCPVGTVMSRLYRARQLLGKALQGYAADQNLSLGRFGSAHELR